MYESDSDPLISRFEQALREDAPLFFDEEEFDENRPPSKAYSTTVLQSLELQE